MTDNGEVEDRIGGFIRGLHLMIKTMTMLSDGITGADRDSKQDDVFECDGVGRCK